MQTVPDPTSVGNLVVRYATLRGEPGYAIRTPDHRALFVDHDAQSVMLTNTDIAALTLLGDVNVAEAQALADFIAGGAAAICVSRSMEVA
jgi:hypothetical protein